MKGLSPEEQIEAALRKRDKSDISRKSVYRKLDEDTSEVRYKATWKF